MKIKNLLLSVLAVSVVSGCGSQQLQPNLSNFPVNQPVMSANKAPVKNYKPLKPGEGEQFDFIWYIYSGRDQAGITKTRKAYDSFMAKHIEPSDIARTVVTEPVEWYSGKNTNGGGYFLEIKLYGVKDGKFLKKTISRDLEKYLGYDKATADSGMFKLYDENFKFLGPGIFFRW